LFQKRISEKRYRYLQACHLTNNVEAQTSTKSLAMYHKTPEDWGVGAFTRKTTINTMTLALYASAAQMIVTRHT